MLRVVNARGRKYSARINKARLDKHIKELAWLIVDNKMVDGAIVFRVRTHITERKNWIKYCEVKGRAILPSGDLMFFSMSDQQGYFRFVADIKKKGKNSVHVHGEMHYCFESILSLVETKSSTRT
jgi:hypothetical protein